MASIRTRRQQIEQRKASMFTGRAVELEQFRTVLEDPSAIPLINLHGISGIGKTTLLEKFIENAGQRGFITVYVDLASVSTREGLIFQIYQQLRYREVEMITHLEAARGRYFALNSKLLDDDSVNPAAVHRVSKAGELGGYRAAASSQTEWTQKDHFQMDKVLGDDAAFFNNPSTTLASALLEDVNNWFVRHPTNALFIVLDRSEAVASDLLGWFREIFLELGDRVVLVIAGQKPLDEAWDNIGFKLELNPLSATETLAFAQKLGVTAAEQQEWVVRASGGVPVFIQTLCEEVLRNSTVTRSDAASVVPPDALMNRFLRQMSPKHRQVFLAGCVLRWITTESAAYVLGEEDGSLLIELCQTTATVKQTNRGYVVHDRILEYCNRYLRQTQIRLYVELNEKAAGYYSKALGVSGESFENRKEEIFHRLRADSEAGLRRLKDEFDVNALLNRSVECEALIEIAERSGTIDENWVSLFKASVLRQEERFAESRNLLHQLVGQLSINSDPELTALTSYYYAVTSWYICDFEAALKYARTASIQLEALCNRPPNENKRLRSYRNRAIGVVGLTQDRLGKFSEACLEIETMITHSKIGHDQVSIAYGLNSFGYFSYHKGDWATADSVLAEAIDVWTQLKSDFGVCYPAGHRAALRTAIHDPLYGREATERIIGLCQSAGNREMQCKCLMNLSWLLFRESKFDASLEAAREAISLAEAAHHHYFLIDNQRLAALAMFGLGKTAAAEQLLETAVSNAQKLGAPYLIRRLTGVFLCSQQLFSKDWDQKTGASQFRAWAADSCRARHSKVVSEFGVVLARLRATEFVANPGRSQIETQDAEWLVRASALMNLNVLSDVIDDLVSIGWEQSSVTQLLQMVLKEPLDASLATILSRDELVRNAWRATVVEDFNRVAMESLHRLLGA